jgi:hypothetical protein
MSKYIKLAVFVFIALVAFKGLPASTKPLVRSECNEDDTCPSLLKENKANPNPKELCEFCSLLAPLGRELIRSNKTQLFKPVAVVVCTLLNITQEPICEQAINLFAV